MWKRTGFSLQVFFVSTTRMETPALCTKADVHCRSSRLPESFLVTGVHLLRRPQLTPEAVVQWAYLRTVLSCHGGESTERINRCRSDGGCVLMYSSLC